MKHNLSYLHLNPGWGNSDRQNPLDLQHSIPEEIVGKHCILELYGCNQQKLNDEAFIRTSLTSASRIAGAKLLKMITHRFKPQGVTGLALLAESHISVHTWPDSRYAAIDVFTCGEKTMPEKACKLLAMDFCAEDYSLKSFARETKVQFAEATREQ